MFKCYKHVLFITKKCISGRNIKLLEIDSINWAGIKSI